MVMDGVFSRDDDGRVRVSAARHPRPPDLGPLLATVARRVARVLARHGVPDGAEVPSSTAKSIQAALAERRQTMA